MGTPHFMAPSISAEEGKKAAVLRVERVGGCGHGGGAHVEVGEAVALPAAASCAAEAPCLVPAQVLLTVGGRATAERELDSEHQLLPPFLAGALDPTAGVVEGSGLREILPALIRVSPIRVANLASGANACSLDSSPPFQAAYADHREMTCALQLLPALLAGALAPTAGGVVVGGGPRPLLAALLHVCPARVRGLASGANAGSLDEQKARTP